MSLKHYLLILLLGIFQTVLAQTFIQTGQIGTFNSASSFSINPAGYFYVSDAGRNEIIKLDTLGKVIKSVGGYGWTESSFDNPADVFANTLNVYVSDKNNNRIQLFDKDLNFLSQFSTLSSDDETIKFRYPTGSAVSTQGDLFILDSDNNRILKYNARGEFQAAIGGYDAGSFSLITPKQFTISKTKILVLDSQFLVLFDQFGNGIKKIKLAFVPDNINSTFRNVCINDKSQIVFIDEANIESGNFIPVNFLSKPEEEIIDALIFNAKLYLLTKNSIMIYKIVSRD
ncbi:MAG: NHL repeat-containing protein [Melioribacteraceae bacterium]